MALVEVDPETGDVDLLEYWATDDCGNVINPMIVDGQVHGGIAQGVAQALFEEAIEQPASGRDAWLREPLSINLMRALITQFNHATHAGFNFCL